MILGLIAFNFNDARKVKICEATKVDLAPYQNSNRTKDTFYSLRMLCEVYYFLPESLSHDKEICKKCWNSGVSIDPLISVPTKLLTPRGTISLDCVLETQIFPLKPENSK